MVKTSTQSKSSTRLIILLDGTWQTDKGDQPPTNIVRLRDLILPKNKEGEPAYTQHIYYDSGVGTGGTTSKRAYDGATGRGLEDIIRGAYRHICHRYQEGMEIFVFGFSRGAFSARSLVGYINAAGLLKAEECSAEVEQKAWEFYLKPNRYRIPAEKQSLMKLCWADTDKTKAPRIKCLGVFDTVGARGIPLSLLRRRNAERYGFHETGLSSIVDFAFHALALDEKRKQYVATLWSYSFHHNNSGIEQVWFPGCHADVGGGVEKDGLSNLSLYWMIKRIADNDLGLALHTKGVEAIKNNRDVTTDMLGGQHLLYHILTTRKKTDRSVSHTQPNGSDYIFKGLERHKKPMREAVHWSVFARMKDEKLNYKPKNINQKAFWESVYYSNTPTDTEIVGRDEQFLDWWKDEADYQAVIDILPKAQHDDFKREGQKVIDDYKASLKVKKPVKVAAKG